MHAEWLKILFSSRFVHCTVSHTFLIILCLANSCANSVIVNAWLISESFTDLHDNITFLDACCHKKRLNTNENTIGDHYCV